MLHVTVAIKENGRIIRKIIMVKDETEFAEMMLARPGFKFHRINTVVYGNGPIKTEFEIPVDFESEEPTHPKEEAL